MDRNTLIALVLILVIWLAWPKWMELLYGKQEQEPITTEMVADSTLADTSVVAAAANIETGNVADVAAPVAESFVDPDENIERRKITIDTDLYRAEISNEGAVIRSWELKEFHTADGERVNLLPPNGRGLGLKVGPKNSSVDLNRSMFSVDADREEYDLALDDSVTIRFEHRLADGRTVYKQMTFHGDRYFLGYDAGVQGGGSIERLVVTWRGEVPPSERDFTTELQHLKAISYVGEDLEDLQFKGEPDSSEFVGLTDWVGIRNKYFLAAFAPSSVDQSEVTLYASGIPNVTVDFAWDLAPFDITQTTVSGLVYLGPIDVDRLVVVGHSLERAADLGWAVIRPISKVVLWTFLSLHKIIPNYGVIVVIFSIFIKLLLHPLTKKSYESTSKMQTLKPKMEELRAKFKDDQQKLNQEMMKLYKEEGFNPLGGCLPMVLQMPIIFAIYAVLGNNIEFRQAPFFGWITDLSAPDTLMVLPFSVPFYGSNFNILPILMAVSMFFQQKLMLTDPKQKMMVYLMPVIMLFVFNRLSSGLVLYWFMFNIMSAGHQYFLVKKKEEEKEAAAAVPAGTARRNTTQKRRR